MEAKQSVDLHAKIKNFYKIIKKQKNLFNNINNTRTSQLKNKNF